MGYPNALNDLNGPSDPNESNDLSVLNAMSNSNIVNNVNSRIHGLRINPIVLKCSSKLKASLTPAWLAITKLVQSTKENT